MVALATFVMRGWLPAAFVVAGSGLAALLLHPFSYLSGGVLALVTLRKGWNPGVRVLGAAAVAAAVGSLVLLGNVALAWGLMLSLWLPVYVMALALRRTVRLDRVILLAGLMGAGIVAFLHGWWDDPNAWLVDRAVELMQATLGAGGLDAAALREVLGATISVGLLAALWVASLVLCVFVGRYWQAALYNPGGFRTEFHRLRLEPFAGWVTVAAMAAALALDGKSAALANDLARLFLYLYVFAGASLLHAWVARRGGGRGWIAGFYVLAVIFPQVLLLAGFAGMVDTWLDMRSQWGKGRVGPGPGDRKD